VRPAPPLLSPRPLTPRADSFFDNVCELDLVFNFYKVCARAGCTCASLMRTQVYAILDEIFLAGEIEETSKDVVLARLDELEKLE
jgi:AP-2 complex subunit sigma-1